jgi:hypothetical protein
MMRNPIYIGKIDSPDNGISTQGDFDPVVDEATFYRAQAVLDGRVVVSGSPTAESSRLSAARFRPLRRLRPSTDRQLVEGAQRSLRVLPLPASLPRGQREQGGARRRIRRRTGASTADAWLHAVGEGSHPSRVGAAPCGSERTDDGAGTPSQSDPAEARPARRSIPLLRVDRSHQLRPPTRQAARGADARQDRANHTEAVDELDVQGILAFAERILPRASDLWVQASLDYKQRLQQLFFPEGIAFDGKSIQSNRRNGTTFQLLGAVREC